MSRMLESGALTETEAKLARERGQYNGDAARNGIDELDRHAKLTPLSEKVLGTLRAYWADIPTH